MHVGRERGGKKDRRVRAGGYQDLIRQQLGGRGRLHQGASKQCYGV